MVQIKNAAKLASPWTHWFLYGKTGSGKTTVAATFPSPFFVIPQNEGSILTLHGRDVDYVTVSNRKDMTEVLNMLMLKHQQMVNLLKAKKEGEAYAAFPYETIVIESLSHYTELVVQDISENNTKQMNQQGWGKLSNHIASMHSILRSMQCHVVYTSLAAVDDSGEGFPMLVGKQKTMLPSSCDVVAYCDVAEQGKKRGSVYTTYFKKRGPFYARSRIQGFPVEADNFEFGTIEKLLT